MEKHFLQAVFFLIVFTQGSNSNPVTKFVTTVIFEHFDNCTTTFVGAAAIVSLFLKNIDESISKLSGLTTWKYGAHTWKDTDHYVFLSQNANIDTLLLSKKSLKIKFRIVVGASVDTGGNPVIKTACSTLVRLVLFKSSKIVYRIEIYSKKHGYWEGKQGPHTNLIQLCQQKMNFTYELFPSIGGGGSGVKWQNGTWKGSMADVLYGNAEF
ncbi:unnamed protein product, partial [Allacma fusca]